MFYPGYVLVEMDMDDHVWHVVKSTPRVTGFVGTGQQPTPLSEEEVQHIVYRVGEAQRQAQAQGQVREERDRCASPKVRSPALPALWTKSTKTARRLKVMVTIFGRSTPVELEFGQVEKVA